MQNKSFGKNILRGIRTRVGKMLNNRYAAVNIDPITLIYYKHLAPGKVRYHRLFGKLIGFLSSTELVHGLEEIFLDEIYKQDLPEKPYIIDCGANIGLSVIYMKRLYPHAEILAFEPDEQNFKLLEENIRSFEFSDVVLRKEAVWIDHEILAFSGQGTTDGKLTESASIHSISVKATRLKEMINRKIDFLKIDIEGAEFPVLMDIRDHLHLVQNLFFEYHGHFNENEQLNKMLELVVNSGFYYYIREATQVYKTPLYRSKIAEPLYDIQLNVFCFRTNL